MAAEMFDSLCAVLRYRAPQAGDRHSLTFLRYQSDNNDTLAVADLDKRARAVAANLQTNCQAGRPAVLIFHSGLDFVLAFFGCLYAGIPAVPVAPPHPNRSSTRLDAIIADSGANVVLTTRNLAEQARRGRNLTKFFSDLTWVAVDDLGPAGPDSWQCPELTPETLAFIQYTSGSTATPKGVMVSHGNLLSNLACMEQVWRIEPTSVMVSWLPTFHDLGLIYGVLQPMFSGCSAVMMAPAAFLQQPRRWLEAISLYRGTHSAAPNFAYDLCCRKIRHEQCKGLDLSSWRMAMNAAEPIHNEVMERFSHTFADFGFCHETFSPAYGLAESTLAITANPTGESPIVVDVAAAALGNDQVVLADKKEPDIQTLVGCGRPIANTDILIVDPKSRRICSCDQVGEVWVSGPTVAQGYWNRPAETEKTFRAHLAMGGAGNDRFLRTGDLGFIRQGELFITGRIKDVVIVRGVNYYPQDIELSVQKCHPALRFNCGAVFSIEDRDTEKVVIMQEVERSHRKSDLAPVFVAIRGRVADEFDLPVQSIVLLEPGQVLRTSSGKIQRHLNKRRFLSGGYQALAEWHASSANTAESSNIADALCLWLRDYAATHINEGIMDERRSIPPHIVLDFGNQGLLGLQVPARYGGLGLNTQDIMRVFQQLAGIDLTLASFCAVHNGLGVRPILRYAQPELRDELLPRLAQGRELASFAITEPAAGSNPYAIATMAEPHPAGGWHLNGTKMWVGTGAWSSVTTVIARSTEPAGMTAFAVRRGVSGLRQGPEALTLGLRGMVQNQIGLEDVPVGSSDVLGLAGDGMVVALDAMNFTRLVLASMSVGAIRRCLQLMYRYASRRTIAGGRLLDNPVTLVRLSRLTAAATAIEFLVTAVAREIDLGSDVPEEVYIACKIAGPEYAWRAADDLVQVLGGRGYIETNGASRLLRDARILRIFEGPTEPLSMHLGASLIKRSETIRAFIAGPLGNPAVAKRLQDAVSRIDESAAHLSFTNPTSGRRWCHFQLGYVAVYALLEAASAEGNGAEWACRCFDEAVDAVGRAPFPVCGAEDLAVEIAGYSDVIGDLDPPGNVVDYEPDPMLRRSPPDEHPTNMPEVTVPNGNAGENTRDAQKKHSVEAVERWLKSWVAGSLQVSKARIDTDQPFSSYGMDSASAVELSFSLEKWLGQTLSPTIAWDFPSIRSLATFVGEDNAKVASKSAAENSDNELNMLLRALESGRESP